MRGIRRREGAPTDKADDRYSSRAEAWRMGQARTCSRWTRGLRASFRREAASPGRSIGQQVADLVAGELRPTRLARRAEKTHDTHCDKVQYCQITETRWKARVARCRKSTLGSPTHWRERPHDQQGRPAAETRSLSQHARATRAAASTAIRTACEIRAAIHATTSVHTKAEGERIGVENHGRRPPCLLLRLHKSLARMEERGL